MSLTLHTLAPKPGSRPKSFRIGRGQSSGRGKTSGKGTKGQKARTGGRKKLKLKGMKQMLLGFPKLRGFQSGYQKPATLPVERLAAFNAGDEVTLTVLRAKRLIKATDVAAKLVGTADLGKKLHVKGLLASASAKEAIEKAGGTLEVPRYAKRSKSK